MNNSKRLSQCVADGWKDAYIPHSPSGDDVEEWLTAWKAVFARGIRFSNEMHCNT